MGSLELHTLIILVFYALASLCGIMGIGLRQTFLRKSACLMAVSGFAAQTLFLLMGSHTAMPGGLPLGSYLQLLAWFMMLCALAGWRKFKMDAPLIFIAPLVLLLFIISLRYLALQIRLPAGVGGSFYAFHVGALFLSLALMALAFGAGIFFVYLNHRLKAKLPISGLQKDIPAINILDKINAFCTAIGFPLFTLGLATGFIFAASVWSDTLLTDPKELISIIIWILFAALFYMRMVLGWRGRKPAMAAIALFSLCLFSILVVNTLMDTHHAFNRL